MSETKLEEIEPCNHQKDFEFPVRDLEKFTMIYSATLCLICEEYYVTSSPKEKL